MGTAYTNAISFKGKMGNSEMQICPIVIPLVPLLETSFKSISRKKQMKIKLSVVFKIIYCDKLLCCKISQKK